MRPSAAIIRHVTPVVPASMASTCFIVSSKRERRPMDAAVAHDGRDQRRRSDVEGRIVDLDAGRRGELPESAAHFVGWPLLDVNLGARLRRTIERARRRGDVEWDAVMLRGDGEAERADLVRGVTV